jgi:hypothetical protein
MFHLIPLDLITLTIFSDDIWLFLVLCPKICWYILNHLSYEGKSKSAGIF